MALAGLLFVGCSKDDQEKCSTCTFSLAELSVTSKYCDKGDGNVEITTDGQTQTVSMNGATFDDFIDGLKRAGANCK